MVKKSMLRPKILVRKVFLEEATSKQLERFFCMKMAALKEEVIAYFGGETEECQQVFNYLAQTDSCQ